VQDDEAIDLERLRIEALLRRGRLDEALPAAEQLLAQIGIRVGLGKSSRTKLSMQWIQKLRGLDYIERDPTEVNPADLLRIDVLYSVVSGLAFVDPVLGRMLQPELLRAAFDCGEPIRVCLALAQELCYAASAGTRSWPAIAAVGTRLKSIVARIDHPHIRGLADVSIGVAAYMGGRWRDARGHLEAGITTLRDHGAGVRWEMDVAETYWLSTLYYLGEWRELIRQGNILLRDAIERGDVVAQQGIRTGRPSLAWLLAGKAAEARAQLDAAEQTLAPGFHLPKLLAVQAACNIDLYCGDAAAAARKLDEAWPNIERIGALRTQHLRIELLLMRARVALADSSRPLDDRLRQARGVADELLKEGAPWATGVGHLVRAAALVGRGQHDQAVLALLAAEDQLVGSDMIGWLHVARLRRGLLEGGPGGTARAEAARDLLRDLGAADPDAVASLLVPWPG
ncbi:MAG: Protein kinase, partial [Myxococcales bacterium]|nr:Protein kinase [Myxococcales bacterium]